VILGHMSRARGGVASAPQRGRSARRERDSTLYQDAESVARAGDCRRNVERSAARSRDMDSRSSRTTLSDQPGVARFPVPPGAKYRKLQVRAGAVSGARFAGCRLASGNYIDERDAGLARNARGYAECLASVPGDLEVWIEGTAGSGTALGARFEQLRDLRDALAGPDPDARRVLPRHGASARRRLRAW